MPIQVSTILQWSKKVIGITKNAKNKELMIKITSNFANMI